PRSSMSPVAYIAVHGGAGVHALNREQEVKRALRIACSKGLSSISNPSKAPESTSVENVLSGSASLAIVEHAIAVLEDDEHLNAGYGSNLTVDGSLNVMLHHVSGQASSTKINLFGSVGAVPGVKNPIKLAKSILDYSRVPDRLGRVPPLTLVSTGAQKFAAGRVETVPEEALIAPNAYEQWKKWKHRLEAGEDSSEQDNEGSLRDIQDTVGAVAFHDADGMAAGVSSGGLLLKHSGRVGEATIFGAGCWATRSMACSVSGTGEHIVRENLARKIGEALQPIGHDGEEDLEKDPHDVLNRVLVDFWDSCRRQGEEFPSVGVILLTASKNGEGKSSVRLWCAFTTPSMAVGYASTANPKAKVSSVADSWISAPTIRYI
ncbi:nucleophile aminohydrolase, partial [Flammula alnicola]